MTDPGRRDIGRVGFEHISIGREGRCQPADLQGTGEGHRATEAQHTTEIDEGRGLLNAAVEGMGDPAARTQPAKVLEHGVLGTAHMHDHWQLEVAGNAKLLDKEALLTCPVQARHEVIESDFADADQPRIIDRPGDRVAQSGQFGVIGLIDMQRVNAKCIAHAGMPRRERGDRLKIEGTHRRYDDAVDTRCHGRIDHVIAIGVEFGSIKVAVGIDEHRCASGRPIRPTRVALRAARGCDRRAAPARGRG